MSKWDVMFFAFLGSLITRGMLNLERDGAVCIVGLVILASANSIIEEIKKK